ncbi:MAG: hypothetical protein AAF716_03845 [Cyanobacteria bacterium P01_D01_bin.1]
MDRAVIEQTWQLLGQVLVLKANAFEALNALPSSLKAVLLVILAAELSQVITHSVVAYQMVARTYSKLLIL